MRLDLGRWREFGLGLLVGLSLSVAVLVWQNYRAKQEATAAAEKPRPDPRAAAIKGTEEISCPFSYAAHLTDILLLGVVSLRAGKKLYYDGENMNVTINTAAGENAAPNDLLTRADREGHSLR